MSHIVQALSKSLVFFQVQEGLDFFLHSSTFDPTIFGTSVKTFLSIFFCPAVHISLFPKLLASINSI